jgi:hypothetical protein
MFSAPNAASRISLPSKLLTKTQSSNREQSKITVSGADILKSIAVDVDG